MWRVANKIAQRSIHKRLGVLTQFVPAGSPSCTAGFKEVEQHGKRLFSRRILGDLDEPDDLELLGEKNVSKTPSASDMEFYSQLADDYDDEQDEDNSAVTDAAYRRKQEEIQRELDSRTGRPWTDPWEITQEQWMSTQTADDLPNWSPEFVSRISQERVQLCPEGIPTLAALASMPLPPPACPHPGLGQAKEYSAYRKGYHYRYIVSRVKDLIRPKLEGIANLSSWQDKQDAIDELFEATEETLKTQEEIIGAHPDFGSWVERAIEDCLTKYQKGELEAGMTKTDSKSVDAEALPVFMDCVSKGEPDLMVPSILSPLRPHPRDGPGRMVEEWELSAHKKTKRILLRQCTREIAETLEKNDSCRIYVHGRRGIGKSAVLASIVASARKSDYLVMYLPDGDRLRKNGFFVTPNALREGMFDLQDLSQEACANFLNSHREDLQGMETDKETMERYFKDSQLQKASDVLGDKMGLVDILNYAGEKKNHAPMCFSVVVDTLMSQTDKPFLMVLDEFNCYFDRGHYFHMAYDKEVRKSIPYNQINLFEHAMAAMALSADVEAEEKYSPRMIKRGGIIVATTDSHAVPRHITEGLTAFATLQSESDDSLTVVEVPRFSDLEVDHVLANFEATGIGNLRLDRGDTVMDKQEVGYLKMISGSVGQKLLDAAVL